MKTKIIIVTIILSLFGNMNVEARGNFWNALRRGLKDVAAAAGSVVLRDACVASGYTEEQSRKMVSDTYEALGLNKRNVDLGLAYVEAENKFERQNVAKEIVFDVASEVVENSSLVEKFRQAADAQLQYLGDIQKATTYEEMTQVVDNRTKAYVDLFCEVYKESMDRKAEYLSNKIGIKEQLEENGQMDENLELEVAGSILAVQNSDIPEEEKDAIIKGLKLNENIDEIKQISAEVMAMDDETLAQEIAAQEEERRIAELKEKEEQERLERERQAKLLEERNNAINTISSYTIPVFVFDETSLTETQKASLDEVADILNKYDDLNISIIGHTCKIGYKSINMKKGLKRAESAKAYLTEKGIAENRIQVDSKGELEPISKINSDNRRIEFKIN